MHDPRMGGMLVIPYSRVLHHSAKECFDWLTDYTDDDPSLTTEVIRERRVLERHPDRVVLEVRNEILGRGLSGRAEVRLFPDELRYEARSLHGDGKGILYTYRLTPLDERTTRLDVAYGTRVRRRARRVLLQLARPLIKRRIHVMWEGFAQSMARDLTR